MKYCDLCGGRAGEGSKTIWTKRGGYCTICWQCWLDLVFELGVEEDEE